MTTPEDAFYQLAGVFISRHNEVLEIEIIPPSLGAPFLKDGFSIGITKKALVQAFTVARRLFAKRLKPMSPDDLYTDISTKSTDSEIPSHVITEIMLLFDCEHLTACNWRKKWLLAAILRREMDQASLQEILETELTLLQTYQCSPLHRHTKSPTLWSHRLWVLNSLNRIRKSSSATLTELGRAELDIVLRAGELHPKNYYAFTYMRNIHAYIAHAIKDQDQDQDQDQGDASAGQVDCIAAGLIDPMLNWCLSNPRDISGWMFAKYLLDKSADLDRADAVRRVLRFALDVGWEGESLWTFVDQAVRQFDLESVINEALSHEAEPDKKISDPTAPHPPKWPWRNRLARARTYWLAARHNN